MLKGAAARIQREQDNRAWLAWHIEALSRTKKLPALEKMMGSKKRRSRRMTADEMVAMAHLWTAAVARR